MSKYLFIGGMREDYFITHDGQVHLGVLGGNAVFAAAGARLWSESVGIISRVGSNYPDVWLKKIERNGIETQGIHILPQHLDTRTFYAYLSEEKRVDTNPASHFLRINHPLPKFLLDYHSSTEDQDDRRNFTPLTIRAEDLPANLDRLQAVHMAPAHFVTHAVLPQSIKERGNPFIILDPSARYMVPDFHDDLPLLLHGLDAFLPSHDEAQSFFNKMNYDIWEMAEAFTAMGCRFAIIKNGARGQYIWDNDSKRRWHIPAYPARMIDVTGAGDSFCGGFLVGFDLTHDPVEAALRGSVSASMTIEGIGPLYPLEALPELAEARLSVLRPAVREI
ncbi:MAG: carbohydrate kinase family protein [Chloroflexi bacterium]|nr:carbohydrate kinase family protein [Chloroflexota bacterium]